MKIVSIIGVGLIGGSIGFDLKEKKLAKKVIGVVRRKESIKECESLGVVDKATLNVKEGVKDADMIILATPISLMPKTAKEIAKVIKKDTIIIDVASVKGKLVNILEKILGRNYIGTHPMAGSEKRGVFEAKRNLFNDARCVITPTKKTSKQALDIIKDFWNKLGSRISIMSPEEHDRLVALTSHLPHLVAASLVNSVLDNKKAVLSIGPGFKDSTRIAGSPPELWKEICEWNKSEVLSSIDKFEKQLLGLKKLIKKEGWADFLQKLKNAKRLRDELSVFSNGN